MRIVGAAFAAAVVLALAPAAAGAATVRHDGARIHFTAGSGTNNYVKIIEGDCDVRCLQISEYSGSDPITLDPATASSQRCVPDPVPSFAQTNVYCEWAPTTIDAGDGSDLVIGGPTDDAVQGGSGNDELYGGEANDALDGGGGDDSLEAKGISDSSVRQASYAGADDLRGGDGNDVLSYYSLTSPLTISVDDQANDPAGDNIHSDIERVEGGNGDDTMTGNDGPNRLEGAGGTDIIAGLGGNDVIDGDKGIDQLNGGPGNDEVQGGSNGDVIEGGPGADSLLGDTTCEQPGCGGPDRIRARDGERDSVSCRDDADTVEADNLDAVGGDCEMVDRQSGPVIPDIPGGGDTTGPDLAGGLAGRLPRLGTALKKGIVLQVTSDEPAVLTGQATVSGRDARGLKVVAAKTVVVAKGKRVLASAGTTTLKLKFTRKAQRKLRSRKKLKLRVTVIAVDGAGNATGLRGSVTLKR